MQDELKEIIVKNKQQNVEYKLKKWNLNQFLFKYRTYNSPQRLNKIMKTRGLKQIRLKTFRDLFLEKKNLRTCRFLFLDAGFLMVNSRIQGCPKKKSQPHIFKWKDLLFILLLDSPWNSNCVLHTHHKRLSGNLRLISFKICDEGWVGINLFKIQGFSFLIRHKETNKSN